MTEKKSSGPEELRKRDSLQRGLDSQGNDKTVEKLDLTEKEKREVEEALYDSNLNRLQQKINDTWGPIRDGFLSGGYGWDCIELHKAWNISEKVLSPAEKTWLQNFLGDEQYMHKRINPRLDLESTQYVVNLLRRRFEAALAGEILPEILPKRRSKESREGS